MLPATSIPRVRRTRRLGALVILATVVIATSCLPSGPSAGRNTPVRKVALIGDSLSWGLFGTTPRIEQPLRDRLAASGISLSLDGGPGDTLDTPWPGSARWEDKLRARIAADDPDVVIIQSVLFPGAGDPTKDGSYLGAATRLFDIAQSRGAHVYIVAHHAPTNPTEFQAAIRAQELQAHAAAGRGISTIPLDWWIARCPNAFVFDGFHLSQNGVNCHADALNAAVNQLRNTVG